MAARRFRQRSAIVAAAAIAAIYLANASWLAPKSAGRPVVLAHRGVSQGYSRDGLTDETCTAARIDEPTHGYLENTLPSIAASFAAGADIVEIDIHPTTDAHFVVFHDWTLDCRTEARGRTRDHSLAELKRLDVGYGYTHDGGGSYPFRGKGVGLMPTLEEVLRAFPGKRFLLNFKSNDPAEAGALVRYLETRGLADWRRLSVYGGWRPTTALERAHPEVRTWTKQQMKRCGLHYVMLGWSSYVPEACRGTMIVVPINFRHLMWGWPNRFLDRMRNADTEVYVTGDVEDLSRGGVTSLDTIEQLSRLPEGYDAGIWTDAVEVIGPAVRQGRVGR